MAPFKKAAPPSGGIDWSSLKDRLVLINVIGQEKDLKTVHGTKDAIRADLVVLDGPDAGDTYDDTLVFPGVLIGQLKRSIGEMVLGRLGQGEKKAGQDPPWVIGEFTEADAAIAEAYLAKRPAFVGASGSKDDAPPF